MAKVELMIYLYIIMMYSISYIIYDAITDFKDAVVRKQEGVPKTMGLRIPGKWRWEWDSLNDAKEPLRLAKQIEIPIVEMVNGGNRDKKPTNRQDWKNWAIREKQ